MALFKISKGLSSGLPSSYTEGYCYFTTDDGKMYIDTTNAKAGRVCLNAAKADQLTTARTITLSGDVSGSVAFDGSKNVTINTTVADNSHNHTITAEAAHDSIVVLTGTNGTNKVKYEASHAKKGPTDGYTSGNTTTSISGSGASKTIKIPQLTVDAYGHVTAAADESVTITMPTIPGLSGGSAAAADATVVGGVTVNGHTVTVGKKTLTAGSNVTITGAADKITIASTNTDTKVTAVGNHYTPTANTNYTLSADASSTTAASWGSTDLVTGVNIQRDAKGHVTGVTVDSIQMPTNPNADTKVTQTITSSNANYPLLLAPANQGATATTGAYFDSGVTLNPSTNTIVANISGNAATATKLQTARTISLTGSVTGSGSFDGSGNLSIATTTNHTHSYLPLSGGTLTGNLNINNNKKLQINTTISTDYTSNSPMEQPIAINSSLASGISLTDANAPGIGFHVSNTTWGNLILTTQGFKFITNTRSSLMNVYAASFIGSLSGNASTATKLQTARTISLTGAVTGSGTFDGSNNLSITTTSNHNHDSTYVNVSGDTMTGALNFANNTWNKMGDDCYIGDNNIAGCVAIKGINSATGLYFVPYNGSTAQKISINGSGTMTITGTIASTFSGNLSGNATTATTASKLGTNAGSATKPVYFANGVPVACTSIALNISGNAATATALTSSAGAIHQPVYFTSGKPSAVNYIYTHPEGNGIVLPFSMGNDLSNLYARGGSVIIYETSSTDFTAASLTNTKTLIQNNDSLFDCSPNYVGYTMSSTSSTVVIEINPGINVYHAVQAWIDCGNGGWGFNTARWYIRELGSTTYRHMTNSGGTYGAAYIGNGGTGFNSVRIVLTGNSSNGLNKRIAQIGWLNYTSKGLRNSYMSTGFDDAIFRNITPGKNNSFNLGSSSNKWANIYATTFNGNATSATKATQDGNGNTITSKYVTLDTTQTISGLKTFKTITISAQDASHEGGEIILSPATSSYKTAHIDLYDNKVRYHDGTSEYFTVDLSTGVARAQKIYGAVWNDYAEYRNQKEEIKPGYCVTATDDGKVYKTTTRLQPCDGVVSDTFGFAIGETDDCKTPLAVAGRVLVYCAGDRNNYHFGDCVCAGPNGLAYKMTDEEIRNYPHRIIGTISEIPNYEVWGSGNIEVNGRIWIKVK